MAALEMQTPQLYMCVQCGTLGSEDWPGARRPPRQPHGDPQLHAVLLPLSPLSRAGLCLYVSYCRFTKRIGYWQGFLPMSPPSQLPDEPVLVPSPRPPPQWHVALPLSFPRGLS